jgi:hypothetical protein
MPELTLFYMVNIRILKVKYFTDMIVKYTCAKSMQTSRVRLTPFHFAAIIRPNGLSHDLTWINPIPKSFTFYLYFTRSFGNMSCSSTADLRKALQLSGGKGKVAANAYCQRGALYRKVRQLS